MTEPRVFASVQGYDELVEALKLVMVERGLTIAVLDEIAGLASGHTGKLFGPARVKSLGPTSMGLVLGALGVRLAVVDDPEQAARMASRYGERERPPVDAHRLSIALEKRLRPLFFRNLGVRGIKARNEKLSPFRRSMLAKRAAQARWAKRPRKQTGRRKRL